MNNIKIMQLLKYIDTEYIPLSIDDLKIALALLNRNQNLLKDYPTLEDAKNIINSKIESESVRIDIMNKNFDELYNEKKEI